MSEPEAPETEPDTDGSLSGDMTPQETARLVEAVAGIARIVPYAPHDILAPRLRTPLFAAFVAVALGTHAAGIGAHILLRGSAGDGGRLANGLGENVIEAEIVDGQDVADRGGATEAAMPGNADPLAVATADRQASRPSPPAAAAPPLPSAPMAREVLASDAPDDVQVAAGGPPPLFQSDITMPSATAPSDRPVAEAPLPPPAEVQAAPEQFHPPSLAANSVSAPEQEAGTSSLSGDGAMAQAVVERPGHDGRAGATPGEIKSYHTRLGARIRSNKPSGRGSRGFVEIAFAIEADGSLRFAEVKRSSGNAFLDNRALVAVRRSAPFPKPPALMNGKQLEFSVPFTFE